MRKRISFTVDESDYEILKEYAALRGYARLSDLARRAVWRFCGQNPLPGKALGGGNKNVSEGIDKIGPFIGDPPKGLYKGNDPSKVSDITGK